MITCRVFQEGGLKHEIPFEPDAIRKAREDDHRVWIDVIDPSDDELSQLQAEFDLHELAVEDSRRWGQRAKIDFYQQHLFLVVHGIDLPVRQLSRTGSSAGLPAQICEWQFMQVCVGGMPANEESSTKV